MFYNISIESKYDNNVEYVLCTHMSLVYPNANNYTVACTTYEGCVCMRVCPPLAGLALVPASCSRCNLLQMAALFHIVSLDPVPVHNVSSIKNAPTSFWLIYLTMQGVLLLLSVNDNNSALYTFVHCICMPAYCTVRKTMHVSAYQLICLFVFILRNIVDKNVHIHSSSMTIIHISMYFCIRSSKFDRTSQLNFQVYIIFLHDCRVRNTYVLNVLIRVCVDNHAVRYFQSETVSIPHPVVQVPVRI